jgi:hypothetical protein
VADSHPLAAGAQLQADKEAPTLEHHPPAATTTPAEDATGVIVIAAVFD